jgi:hypothetical protein
LNTDDTDLADDRSEVNYNIARPPQGVLLFEKEEAEEVTMKATSLDQRASIYLQFKHQCFNFELINNHG